jgi:alkylhydroperoxidase family enzyme
MSKIAMTELPIGDEAAIAQYDRFPTNLTRMLLRTNGCTSAFLDLGIALRSTRLDAMAYELVILRVASLSHSAYERMQHLEPARQAGWSDSQIAAIESGNEPELDERSAALLGYVTDCVRNVRVSDHSFLRLKKHLSDAQIADATLLVGFYMMTARFLESLEVDLDASPSDILLVR